MKPANVAIQAALAAAFVAGCATEAKAPIRPGYGSVEPFQRNSSPADPEAWYALGRYYQGQSRWDEAEKSFRRVLVANPAHAEAHNALGAVLAGRGLLAAAEGEFTAAAQAAPEAAHIRGNLGRIQMLQGRNEEALATLQEAYRLDPENPSVRSNLAQAFARSGKEGTVPQLAAAPVPVPAAGPEAPEPVAPRAAAPVAGNSSSVIVTVVPPVPAKKDLAALPSVPLEDSRSSIRLVQAAPAGDRASGTKVAGLEAVPVAAAPSLPAVSPAGSAERVEAKAPPAATPSPSPTLSPGDSRREMKAEAVAVAKPPIQVEAEPQPQVAMSQSYTVAEPRAVAMPLATPAAIPASTAAESSVPSRFRLEVSNGNGVTGMARQVRLWLFGQGYGAIRVTNQLPYQQRATVVQYRSGFQDQAHALGDCLLREMPVIYEARLDPRADVRVVLGRDLPRDYAVNGLGKMLLASSEGKAAETICRG